MKPLSIATLLFLLTACTPESPDSDDPFGRTPAQIDAERTACAEASGTFREAGLFGALTCIKPTVDAGKSCAKESDCEGFCLAETRSCAPITPIFGCTPILMDNGNEATLCVD